MRTTKSGTNRRAALLAAAAGALALAWSAGAQAQSFVSGSTGADGALNLTGQSGTINFEPGDMKRVLGRDLDFSDNVFNFTSITIPQGVTLKMSAKWTLGPVYWLATQNVEIRGTVDLNGELGYNGGRISGARRPSIPGPGGFGGNVGTIGDDGTYKPAQSGFGPGGGPGASQPGIDSHRGKGGTFTGNKFLVPLIGGSGGGGGSYPSPDYTAAGGGAGGGAILISSTGTIGVYSPGIVKAQGAHGGNFQGGQNNHCGGPGSGGGIRLVATSIEGNGALYVDGADSYCLGGYDASPGRIRIEAFTQAWTFSLSGNNSTGTPVSSYVPSASSAASVTVISIGGVAPKATPPTGEFTPADFPITSTGPVNMQIHASNVPLGTIVKVHLFSLEGPDQFIDSTPLMGVSAADSTATAAVTFPAGFTRGLVRAKW
jgi:hypothetical protein